MFKKLVSRSNNARKAPSRQAIGVVQWAQLFRIAHILPGRVRLRFKALKGCATTADNLQSHLGSVEGIRRVEINPLTGSLLLGYDPCSLRSPQFLDAFSEALGRVFPEKFAPGRVSIIVKHLKGNDAFAGRITEQLAPVSGIHRIEIDPITGACLLEYDSQRVTEPAFLEEVSGPLGELLPGLDIQRLLTRTGLK